MFTSEINDFRLSTSSLQLSKSDPPPPPQSHLVTKTINLSLDFQGSAPFMKFSIKPAIVVFYLWTGLVLFVPNNAQTQLTRTEFMIFPF